MAEPDDAASDAGRTDVDALRTRLAARIQEHQGWALAHSHHNRRTAVLFNYLLPLLALALALIVTQGWIDSELRLTLCAIIAGALTVLSTLRSIMRPEERFQEYAQIGIALQEIAFALDALMAQRDRSAHGDFVEKLEALNRRLSEVGSRMAQLPIPRPTL